VSACEAAASSADIRSPSGGGKLFAQELAGALDLQRAHPRPGETRPRPATRRRALARSDASRPDDRNARRAPVRRRAPPARPRPDLAGLGRENGAGVLETRAHRGGVPQPRGGLFRVRQRESRRSSQRRRPLRFQVVPAAAGPHEPRPKAIAADQRGEVQEVAANLAARRRVGRNATSPASAPRSPVWLASRSSSSARARSHCARNGASVPASASMTMA
jgi:hypothetical protein